MIHKLLHRIQPRISDLSVFKAFSPIPILLDAENGYRISPGALKKEMLGRGLSALLVSNPCNPTGQLIEGEELGQWCELARECQCSLMLDEFYSHYIYTGGTQDAARMAVLPGGAAPGVAGPSSAVHLHQKSPVA